MAITRARPFVSRSRGRGTLYCCWCCYYYYYDYSDTRAARGGVSYYISVQQYNNNNNMHYARIWRSLGLFRGQEQKKNMTKKQFAL